MGIASNGMDVQSWAPLIATLIGWFIVNYQNNKRERRKEGRSAADRCKSLTVGVCDLGVKYWICNGETIPWSIRAQLDQLETELEFVNQYNGQSPISHALVQLIDAITDGQFESNEKQCLNFSDPRISRIRTAQNKMLREIERQFRAQYI